MKRQSVLIGFNVFRVRGKVRDLQIYFFLGKKALAFCLFDDSVDYYPISNKGAKKHILKKDEIHINYKGFR